MILEKKQDKNIQMERCIKLVNNYFNTEIRIRSCKRLIVEPRQIYYYLMIKNSQYSLASISSYLGYDHATAIHGNIKIQSLIDLEPKLKENINTLDIPFKKLFGIKVKTKTSKEILMEYLDFTKSLTEQSEAIINNFLENKNLL